MEKIVDQLEELRKELTGIQQVTLSVDFVFLPSMEIQMCGYEGGLCCQTSWVQTLALPLLLLWASLPLSQVPHL